MGKSLLVVEFKEEAEFFYKNRPELFNENLEILTLLPEASAFFERRQIKYHTTVRYFPKQSHERGVMFADDIIQEIYHVADIKDSHGIKHAYVNAMAFYLRPYLSYIFFVLETVSLFIEAHQIQKIYASRYRGNDYSNYSLEPKERFIGELMEPFRGRCSIETSELSIANALRPSFVHQMAKDGVSAFLNALELKNHAQAHPSALFYSLKFNLDHVARNLKGYKCFNLVPEKKSFYKIKDHKAGLEVLNVHLNELWPINDPQLEESCKETLRQIIEAHQKEQLFSYKGMDFSAIVLRKIKEGYFQDFKKLNRKIFSLKKILNILKPSVILAALSREISFALGELSRMLNIPSLLISHGSHVPPQDEYSRREWMDHGKGLIDTQYQYHLLQTPWAVEYVYAMKADNQYYRIFPVVFPQVDRRGNEEKKAAMYPASRGKRIVMHAGTPKARGSNKPYIYETLDEYIDNIKDLIDACAYMPDIFLIIRFRPSTYLNEEDFKALLPSGNHYTVASEGSFADYLKITDLLVSFSSTTIEEALINRIPVLQYDSSGRYAHIVGPRWNNKGFAHVDSVYYIGDRASLASGLRWFIQNHLNATTVGDIFQRHIFAPGEAIRVEEFIERLLKGDLPQAIPLNEKKHFNLGEMYDS